MTERFSEIGPFKDKDGVDIFVDADSFVKAGDELLPLCHMCVYSPLTCENTYVRDVNVPLEDGDEPTIGLLRQPDGSLQRHAFQFKTVDGVAAGIYKKEEDIPAPFICDLFQQKPLG